MQKEIKKALVLAGTHGCEPQSTFVIEKIADQFCVLDSSSNYPFNLYLPQVDNGSRQLTVIPNYNHDGLLKGSRGNANGVDLNRNMPAKNWTAEHKEDAYFPGAAAGSEKESQALVEIFKQNSHDFDMVFSFHTTHYIHHETPPQVNYDGIEDPKYYGYQAADELAKILEVPLTFDIGYPTPGSLGSYCREYEIPCATVELDDDMSGEEIWGKFSAQLLKFFKS